MDVGEVPSPSQNVRHAFRKYLNYCWIVPVITLRGLIMSRFRALFACLLVFGVAACDGRRGDPPGTVTSRAVDRAAGTNTSGAYPLQSDGMPGNRPGTAVGRATNELLGTTGRR